MIPTTTPARKPAMSLLRLEEDAGPFINGLDRFLWHRDTTARHAIAQPPRDPWVHEADLDALLARAFPEGRVGVPHEFAGQLPFPEVGCPRLGPAINGD